MVHVCYHLALLFPPFNTSLLLRAEVGRAVIACSTQSEAACLVLETLTAEQALLDSDQPSPQRDLQACAISNSGPAAHYHPATHPGVRMTCASSPCLGRMGVFLSWRLQQVTSYEGTATRMLTRSRLCSKGRQPISKCWPKHMIALLGLGHHRTGRCGLLEVTRLR